MQRAASIAEPNSSEDDGLLMARLQAGDDTALAMLMSRWEMPVKAVIARIVLNATEAEDLAQEAFVRVWQQRGRFRPGAEFRPWLFAIAINLARNRLRWWRRRPEVTLDQWDNAGGREVAADAVRVPGEGSVRWTMEQAELAAAVRAAIAALPVDLREALILSEYELLSQAEIAKIVGATVKAVETRIYRAKQKLRHALRAVA